MFRASIWSSSGVYVVYVLHNRMWCSALGVVAEVLRSRCVLLCTGVSFSHVVLSADPRGRAV
jgi:hypothetical protein